MTHSSSEGKSDVKSVDRHVQDTSHGQSSENSDGNDEQDDVPSP